MRIDPAQSPAQTLHSPEEGSGGVESFAAFARRLGVARSTVTRAAQAGRLVLAALPDGQRGIAVHPSLQRWHASRGLRFDLVERHAAQRGQAIPGSQALLPVLPGPATASEPAGEGEGAIGESRALLQAQTLRWQNALLELGMQLERGHQLPRSAVLQEAQGLGAALRALVERLIDQTAPRLAAAGLGPQAGADRARLLRIEAAQARRQLRGEFARAMRRLKPQADSASPLPPTSTEASA